GFNRFLRRAGPSGPATPGRPEGRPLRLRAPAPDLLKSREIDRALLARALARRDEPQGEQRVRAEDENQLGSRRLDDERRDEIEERREEKWGEKQRIEADRAVRAAERHRGVLPARFRFRSLVEHLEVASDPLDA